MEQIELIELSGKSRDLFEMEIRLKDCIMHIRKNRLWLFAAQGFMLLVFLLLWQAGNQLIPYAGFFLVLASLAVYGVNHWRYTKRITKVLSEADALHFEIVNNIEYNTFVDRSYHPTTFITSILQSYQRSKKEWSFYETEAKYGGFLSQSIVLFSFCIAFFAIWLSNGEERKKMETVYNSHKDSSKAKEKLLMQKIEAKEQKEKQEQNDTTGKKSIKDTTQKTPPEEKIKVHYIKETECPSVQECIEKLDQEKNEEKRKIIVDELTKQIEIVRVEGSRGNQVGIYNKEKDNVWIGVDKVGDEHYEVLRVTDKELVLRLVIISTKKKYISPQKQNL